MILTKGAKGKHLYVEIITQLSKTRWIFVNIIFIIISICKIIGLKRISVAINQEFTVFDSWLYLFSNKKIMVFILLPLFFYVVSDVLWNSQIDEYVLIRTNSRVNWLMTKVKSMFIISVIYYMNATLITVVLSFFMFKPKLSIYMSEKIINYFSLDINPVLINFNTIQVFVLVIVINTFGLFALCFVQGIISWRFKNNIYGWLFGIGVVIIGLIEISTPIHNSFIYLMPHKNLVIGAYNPGEIVFEYKIFILRLIYWFLVFMFCLTYSYYLVKKYSFMSGGQSDE